MNKKEATKEARVVLARVLGVDADNIKVVIPKWFQLMQEGVLVSVHIGRWRGRSKLTYTDLGLPELDEDGDAGDLLTLGSKFLLPPKLIRKADAIESKARKYLKKSTFQTYWGSFVGVSGFDDLMDGLEELRKEYFALCDMIIGDFDNVLESLKLQYKAIAEDAYHRLVSLSPEAISRFDGPEDFIETFQANILALIPGAEEIRKSWDFTIELSYIPLPSLLQEDLEEAKRIELERESELAIKAERRRELLAIETAKRIKAELEKRKAQEALSLQRDAETRKAEALARMNKEVVRQAREQKEELIEGFLSQIVGDLRSVTFEAAADVLESIKRNKRLVPRSVVQLKGLLEKLDQMNFLDDQEVSTMIEEVRGMVEVDSEDRDVEAIRASLENIAVVTKADLIGLGASVRSSRSIGVPDNPTPVEVTRARRALGLAGEVKAAELTRSPRQLSMNGA